MGVNRKSPRPRRLELDFGSHKVDMEEVFNIFLELEDGDLDKTFDKMSERFKHTDPEIELKIESFMKYLAETYPDTYEYKASPKRQRRYETSKEEFEMMQLESEHRFKMAKLLILVIMFMILCITGLGVVVLSPSKQQSTKIEKPMEQTKPSGELEPL